MAIIILRWFHLTLFLIALTCTEAAFSASDVDIRGLKTIGTDVHSLRANLNGLSEDLKVQAKLAGNPDGKFPPPKQLPKISFKMANKWKLPSVKTAVKAGLKFGKTNLYTLLGTAALGYVLDKTGWFEEDNQLMFIDETDDDPLTYTYDPKVKFFIYEDGEKRYSDNPQNFCNQSAQCAERFEEHGACITSFAYPELSVKTGYCRHINTGQYSSPYVRYEGNCASGEFTQLGCVLSKQKNPQTPKVVTDAMIEALNLDDYTPDDSDIPMLSPHLGTPDETVITEQPKPIVLPTETTTTQNPDGSTTTTATDTTVNVTINTTNQGDMYVTTTETTTTTTYQDGTQTGKTTETKTTDHKDSTVKDDDDDEEKQEIKVEFPEIPTDCDFFPTACKFFEWVKEPFNEPLPEQPKSVQEITGLEQKRTIEFGNAQCPAPLEMDTTLAGHLSLKFDAWCEFARMIKYLVLAAAYLLAIRINLGVIRG